MTAAVAIPARLASSRLPRKVLLDLAGKTLLQRTHEVAVKADCGPVVVLTDSDEVAEEVRSFRRRGDDDRPRARVGHRADRLRDR